MIQNNRVLPLQLQLSTMSMVLVLISACGGGGGSPKTDPSTSSWPNSGNYEVVLKPSGVSTASPLQTSLSLVHSSTPDTEYQIDTSAASTNLGVSLNQGQWNATQRHFTNLQNTAYIDHRNGTLRVTSLLANGARPAQSTAPATNLCSTSQLARNFSKPFASQLIVDTAGTDGICNTPDDGQLRITFSDDGAPSIAAVPSQSQFLGYLRSPTTGQPTHWFVVSKNSGQADLWSIDQPGTTIIEAGTSASTPQFASVANLSDLILYTQNGLLKALRMVNGTPSISNIPASIGNSSGKLAGNDANNAYVYFSSGSSNSCSGTWQISSVSRSAASASTLATGSGYLIGATNWNGAVYASVCSGNTASLIKVDTTTGTKTVLKAPSPTIYMVSTLSGELAVMGISSSDNSWSLNFLDQTDNVLNDAGNAMFFGANQTTYDTSSNTFMGDSVYVMPQTALSGMGGMLRRWDVASSTMHTVGTLPSSTDLTGKAGNRVYTGPLAPSALIGGTFVAGVSSDNQIQASGSRVYTLLPKIDNSLVLTTKQVK